MTFNELSIGDYDQADARNNPIHPQYDADADPVNNILNAIKNIQEVCTIYCATANPAEVVIAESVQGRGIMGVIDGEKPRGVECPDGVAWRTGLLRKFGYKRG
jgi:adenosine/AMP kinase